MKESRDITLKDLKRICAMTSSCEKCLLESFCIHAITIEPENWNIEAITRAIEGDSN